MDITSVVPVVDVGSVVSVVPSPVAVDVALVTRSDIPSASTETSAEPAPVVASDIVANPVPSDVVVMDIVPPDVSHNVAHIHSDPSESIPVERVFMSSPKVSDTSVSEPVHQRTAPVVLPPESVPAPVAACAPPKAPAPQKPRSRRDTASRRRGSVDRARSVSTSVFLSQRSSSGRERSPSPERKPSPRSTPSKLQPKASQKPAQRVVPDARPAAPSGRRQQHSVAGSQHARADERRQEMVRHLQGVLHSGAPGGAMDTDVDPAPIPVHSSQKRKAEEPPEPRARPSSQDLASVPPTHDVPMSVGSSGAPTLTDVAGASSHAQPYDWGEDVEEADGTFTTV
ncbi:serine/arginine repetitive matrix protein 1-like [Schistocerca americana]|uniref:serine/arginine repetitive matrix protein 1-like n=1 Tax=Schistocerca americana TaxID=7009 RepID=UPI001F4F528E|nr:serine/arginine repetitive matrix protein 1-like [Schistocerca americana]